MTAPTPRSRTRRAYLAGIASTSGLAAGCSGDIEESGESRRTTRTETVARDTTMAQTGTTSRPTPTEAIFPGYEITDLAFRGPDGARRGSISVAIADTRAVRYTGLSDTESLPWDWGMLFVYEQADDLTFVMREMDFGIDIVYADADRTITSIHHAPAPGPDEDGDDQRYPGFGQYVVEVTLDWTTEHAVEVGDTLAFDL